MAEVNSGLEHLPHGDGHDKLRLRVVSDTPRRPPDGSDGTHQVRRARFWLLANVTEPSL
jgi:hypothetical protein